MRLVLATANPDKVSEIGAIVTGVELAPRPESVPEIHESGDSLEDNARLKAKVVMEATGQPALADDTGLEVTALGGEPGVRSARYAGEGASYADNVAKLLEVLRDSSDRRARFRTVAVALFPDGDEVMAEGVIEGEIAREPRGSGGFGYDPVFIPLGGEGLTFAEMTASAKNAMSHRGRAFRALSEGLARRS